MAIFKLIGDNDENRYDPVPSIAASLSNLNQNHEDDEDDGDVDHNLKNGENHIFTITAVQCTGVNQIDDESYLLLETCLMFIYLSNAETLLLHLE